MDTQCLNFLKLEKNSKEVKIILNQNISKKVLRFSNNFSFTIHMISLIFH